MTEHRLAAIALGVLAACSPGGGDDGSATAGDTAFTTTGEPVETFPTEGSASDSGFNPDFRRVLGGTTVESAYTRVRVGQLDRVDATGCCADYVLAGPAQNHVKILFGAPSRGLLFLADTPDQTFTMGPATVGIDDIVVGDFDADGREDVLALRSDGIVGIRRGVGVAAPALVLSEQLIEVPLTTKHTRGRRSLALADLDCLGKPDLVAVSPADDHVVYALAVPGDVFSPAQVHATGAGTAPQQLAVGDVDGDGDNDIITGNSHGSASVLRNDCAGAFAPAVEFPLFTKPFDTPGMQVAIGRMCIGETTSHWPAIALGHADQVFILCGNSKGTFDAVGEEPSADFGAAVDYIMDSNEDGTGDGATVFQLQYWEPTLSLHVLWSGQQEVVRFVASPLAGSVGPGVPVADLAGRDFIMGEGHKSFALHRSQAAAGLQWTHIVRLVQGSSLTDIGFAR